MKTAASLARNGTALEGLSGVFVARFRNRPFGHEEVSVTPAPGSCILIRATTIIDAKPMSLHQEMSAIFDEGLRPRLCEIAGSLNGQPLEMRLEIGDEEATVQLRHGERADAGTHRLTREPLLLVDNCFVLHAVAGLAVGRGIEDDSTFASIPAFDEMKATRGAGARVLLGGHDFDPPAVTLHLAPHLSEYVWIEDVWVHRLVIPTAHMIVDWRSP
jgi:hypothetical protein